ncbi:MAG: glutamate--tRNA ligase [Spirochaetes bacterium]|nr:glutamate--tRNA ligase [Spirochaetota bacterium]
MRLRFAPSPTGYIHIGNVRTAVYNYIIAKKYNAELILRIEDTDKERSTKEYETMLIEDLKWLGLAWAEGPDTGGSCGPYRQSERFKIYKDFTERLLQNGNAYHCYCTPEELEAHRKEAAAANKPIVYSGRCRNLPAVEKMKFEAMGRKPSVRFKLPEDVSIEIDDKIKGRVVFDSENIGGDFIIVRSDGVPVYNYIVVIDDAMMKITNIIRGEDHLSNTPKQILVAKALGFTPPVYAHHGLVLGPDRSKLSKRHGITSLRRYREQGYLADALLNYLSMLGWASESGEEIFSIDEIAKQIDIEKLSNSPAVFDFQKLKWMNGQYLRKYPLDKITDLFIPYIKEAGYDPNKIEKQQLEVIISILQKKCDLLSEIKSFIGIFLAEVLEPDEETDMLLKEEDSKKIITEAYEFIKTNTADKDSLIGALVSFAKGRTGLKGKKLFMPIRGILTGRLKGPELDDVVPVIGLDKSRKRIEYMFNRYI